MAEQRPNPHNPPGTGNGRTRRRNARRAREAAKVRALGDPLTGDQLRNGGFNAVAKVTLVGGGYAFGYVSCLDPRVRVVVRREALGAPKMAQIQVGSQTFGRKAWDEAAAALALLAVREDA